MANTFLEKKWINNKDFSWRPEQHQMWQLATKSQHVHEISGRYKYTFNLSCLAFYLLHSYRYFSPQKSCHSCHHEFDFSGWNSVWQTVIATFRLTVISLYASPFFTSKSCQSSLFSFFKDDLCFFKSKWQHFQSDRIQPSYLSIFEYVLRWLLRSSVSLMHFLFSWDKAMSIMTIKI